MISRRLAQARLPSSLVVALLLVSFWTATARASFPMEASDIQRHLDEGAVWLDLTSVEGHGVWLSYLDRGYALFLERENKLLYSRLPGDPTVTSTWRVERKSGEPDYLCFELASRSGCGPVLKFRSGGARWFYDFRRGERWFPSTDIIIEKEKPDIVAKGEAAAAENAALKAKGIDPEELKLLQSIYVAYLIGEACSENAFYFSQAHLDELKAVGEVVTERVADKQEIDKAWAKAVQDGEGLKNLMALQRSSQAMQSCRQQLEWWTLFRGALQKRYKIEAVPPPKPF